MMYFRSGTTRSMGYIWRIQQNQYWSLVSGRSASSGRVYWWVGCPILFHQLVGVRLTLKGPEKTSYLGPGHCYCNTEMNDWLPSALSSLSFSSFSRESSSQSRRVSDTGSKHGGTISLHESPWICRPDRITGQSEVHVPAYSYDGAGQQVYCRDYAVCWRLWPGLLSGNVQLFTELLNHWWELNHWTRGS